MLLFIQFEGRRYTLDVTDGETVGELKERVKTKFMIQDSDQVENTVMTFNYAGSELQDQWVVNDLGITPGETLRVGQRDEVKPVLFVFCPYNDDTVSILDQIQVSSATAGEIRTLVSRKTGLPVSVFRLVTDTGRELYDQHQLGKYGKGFGDTLTLHVWNGWDDFLNLCSLGFAGPVMKNLSEQEPVARYQMKVALYMASHYGHSELSSTLMKAGVRPDEPVGDHPTRQWASESSHPDLLRAPVHEATYMGQLNLLRVYVANNSCCILQRDGNGLMPLNIALRNRIRHCAEFLLSKQFARVPIKDTNKNIPLTLYNRAVGWAERARLRVLRNQGHHKSTLKKKPFSKHALVGLGCEVLGFSAPSMSGREVSLREVDNEQLKKYRPRFESPTNSANEPEYYFRALNKTIRTQRKVQQQRRGSKLYGTRAPVTQRRVVQLSQDDDRQTTPVSDSDETDSTMSRLPPLVRRASRPFRSVSNRDLNTQLPRIGNKTRFSTRSQQNLSLFKDDTTGEEDNVSDVESKPQRSTFLLKTPSEKQRPERVISPRKKRKKERSIKSAVRMARARNAAGSIPLPMRSMKSSPRPYFHVGIGSDLVGDTLNQIESARGGITGREKAIETLSAAQSFKEKPWLGRVRHALAMSYKGIRRLMIDPDKRIYMSKSVQGTADTRAPVT